MVRKTNFLSISVMVSEVVTFMSKKNSFLWISPCFNFSKKQCFKTTDLPLFRLSLAFLRYVALLCGEKFGLHCGEKQFLLIFIRFYWFDQKYLLKQIQIFLRIFPFSNMVRKTNFLSISVLVSEITFMSLLCLKRTVFYEFLQKCFKTTERHSLAVCGLLFG